MTKLGVMEGRLSPPEPGRFQSFPRSAWAGEFVFARTVPLDYIEWIYDAYGADINPLTNDPRALVEISSSTGVAVRSLCADYFMDYPLVRCTRPERSERLAVLEKLLSSSARVGIKRLVIPFVDASSISSSVDADMALETLHDALPAARLANVELHLETDLPPDAFAAFLDRISDPIVKVNYDSGNSASLGFRPSDEFAAYGRRIGSIHIKDRLRGGATVPLGTGDCDFESVFTCLRAEAYDGDFTLQVARAIPGDEVAWTRKNREFVERYWPLR